MAKCDMVEVRSQKYNFWCDVHSEWPLQKQTYFWVQNASMLNTDWSEACFNPLSANFTEWSNTLKQFVGLPGSPFQYGCKLQVFNFIKKRRWQRWYSMILAKFFRTTFQSNTAASVFRTIAQLHRLFLARFLDLTKAFLFFWKQFLYYY